MSLRRPRAASWARRHHRLRLLVVLGALLVAASACQVRSTVTVDVDDDGSGTVEVAVGLDGEAVARLPDLDRDGASTAADLAALLRVDDLEAVGWDVTVPSGGDAEPDGDGYVWARASKAFGTPDEAGQVLAEVTGPDGPLRDVEVRRDEGFGHTRYRFEGTADLSGGLEALGDEGLAGALGGEPLGEDAAAIEAELGQPLSEVFTLEVVAELPGAISTGGSARASTRSSSATWTPELGGAPVAMEATGTVRDWPVLVLAGVAVACAVGLLVLLVGRLRRRRAGA